MKLRINDRQRLLNEFAVDRTESKLASALSKFGSQIFSVTLDVDDVNGPKGGVDKFCRLVVSLRTGGEIVAESKDEKLSVAIARAINRVERGIGRRLQKRLDVRNRRLDPRVAT